MLKLLSVCTSDHFQGYNGPVLAVPVHHFLNRHDFIYEINKAYQNDEGFPMVDGWGQRLNQFSEELNIHPFTDLCTSTTTGEGETVFAYIAYDFEKYTHVAIGLNDVPLMTVVTYEYEGRRMPLLNMIAKVTTKMCELYPNCYPEVIMISDNEYHVTMFNPRSSKTHTACITMGFND